MKERFFLYRIDVFGANSAVDQAVQRAATILTDRTDTPSTIPDQTPETAQSATDLPIPFPLVKHGFFHSLAPPASQLTTDVMKLYFAHSPCQDKYKLIHQKFVEVSGNF
jgi:hypothetical protein